MIKYCRIDSITDALEIPIKQIGEFFCCFISYDFILFTTLQSNVEEMSRWHRCSYLFFQVEIYFELTF